MSVGGQDDDPGYLFLRDELEDLLAFAVKPVPCVFGSRFHLGRHGNVGAENGEGCGFLEDLLEPLHLGGPKHGRVFPLGRLAVVATVNQDEVDLPDPKVEPASGLFFASAVVGVVPVVFEHVPYVALPLGFFDGGPAPTVVGGEIVIVPNGVNRDLLGQF